MIDLWPIQPNVPIRRDALSRLWTRARDRRLGELKVSLPEVRVWLADGPTRRAPLVITYEVKQGEAWRVVDLQEVPRASWEKVGGYVATGGWSADPRVARIVFHTATGIMEVFAHDGSRL